jgi:ABC-2 type transport system permease protein
MTDFNRLLKAEWIKLRSLRSTWWTLGAMIVVTIGIGSLGCALNAAHWSTATAADRASWDPTNQSLSGTIFGQLAIAVFGVLAITGEFSSGTIRSSVAAAPRRTPLLLAKAVVYGGAALVAGEVISLASFFIGQAIMSGRIPTASLGQPGVLRAVLLAGVYLVIVAWISLAIGFAVRHTAGAITAIVALLLVVPGVLAALPSSLQNSIGKFLPEQIAGSSTSAVVREAHAFSPSVGLGLLVLYAAVALGLAGWSLRARDI